MKFSTILSIGIAILTLINIAAAQPVITYDLFDNEHYFIAGHVYPPYSEDNIVTLINTRTNEWLTVTARDCDEDGRKVYLFDLANLHQGWTYDDEFTINYGSEFIHFKLIKDSLKLQQDIQRPDDVDPIYIFTGFLVVAAGGGYFYMKKRKSNQEVTTVAETPIKEEQAGFKLSRDFGVRALISTLLILGCIISILYAMYLGNNEMITSIATVYGSAITAVIVFYFNDRSKNS